MRWVVRWTAMVCAVLLGPYEAQACGFTPVGEDAEPYRDALEHLLTDPRLPLLDPDWYAHYWVLAWARANGKQLSSVELATLLDETDLSRQCSACEVTRASERWETARASAAGRVGAGASPPIDPYRFERYGHHLVCGPDAFDAAAATLGARAATYGDAELRAWIEAQDRVFARCSAAEAPLPAPVSGTGAQDREYQIAAAELFGGDLSAAAQHFDAIAGSASPWADLARYRAAFARFAAGTRDAADLRRRLAATHDAKARRGLGQLLDRTELYERPPAEVTDELTRRLLTEDLGEDIVRVVQDIVVFAHRAPCDTEIGRVIDLRGGNQCDPALPRTPFLEIVAVAIAQQPAPAPAGLSSELFVLNRAFHDARHAIANGQLTQARRIVRRERAHARASSRGTINAFRALELALRPSAPDPAVLVRYREGSEPALHGDAREALRALSSATWRQLAGDRRLPAAARVELATQGLLRSVLLGRHADATAFARLILGNSASDADLVAALRALPASGVDREIALLLLIAHLDPADASIEDELGLHYPSLPESGCALDACDGRTPAATPIGRAAPIAVTPSADRERIAAAGRRINLIGRAALRLARAHPSHPRTPELLARFVQRTRRASVHGATDEATGPLSREAFQLLHRAYPSTEWARTTRHWYR